MTLLEQASDAIAVTDVEGNLLEVNNRAVELFGYPKEELLGKHFTELHPQEKLERVSEAFRNAVKEGSGALNDTAILRKDGTAVAVDITGSVIEIEGARFVQGFFRDITERKHAEESLRQSESALRELSAQLLSAQEAERARLAGDLHDGVGQTLGSIKVRAETLLKKAMISDGEVDAESLKDLVPVIRTAMEEVRNISTELRPSTLDSLGLIATVNWFCREFKSTYEDIGVEVGTEIQEHEIPGSLKVPIFRILQEALNNVAKHSEAHSVKVYLGLKDGLIRLNIEDNGSGVDLKRALSLEDGKRGFGIPSMKQRAEYSGGSLSLESTDGRGTSVQASWSITA
jgi:PAS domain S-box-containing protein